MIYCDQLVGEGKLIALVFVVLLRMYFQSKVFSMLIRFKNTVALLFRVGVRGLCWGLTTRQLLWVILCRLPEKGRREIVEEMKERDRGERKMNDSEETKEIKTFPLYPYCCKDSRPCPTASQYQLDAPVM